MKNPRIKILVRTGHGALDLNNKFTDYICDIYRIPTPKAAWKLVTYKGKSYRLGGGIKTDHYICLDDKPKTKNVFNTILQGQLEIDHNRGVIWFNTSDNDFITRTNTMTAFRICGLPPIPQDQPLDISFKAKKVSWKR